MEEHSVSNNLKRTQRDYSLSFKLLVISEVECGDMSYKEAQIKYGIQGRSTVLTWLRKHGRLDWRSSKMDGKKTPQQKIKDLEKKLNRLEMEKEILNRTIDIADEMYGTKMRKKYLSLLSEASGNQGIGTKEAEK